MCRLVGPQESHSLMREGWAYVDVRSVPEFDRGHPPGAYNVPLLELRPALGGLVLNPDFVRTLERVFGRKARLILGCQMGIRSARAAEMLEAAGFEHVVDHHPGWDGTKDAAGRLLEPGWALVGLPAETSAPAERAWARLRRST